jgi:hypothetical protein
MREINQFLLIAFFCLMVSIFSFEYFTGGFLFTKEISQLSIIFLTITTQALFILKIRRRYQSNSLFLLHPLFYINVTEIAFFFVPFIFFLFNKEFFYKSYIYENSFPPLVIYCLSLLSFNIVCYLLELFFWEQKSLPSVTLNIDLKKREILTWIIIYIFIWFIRFGTLYTASYWHSFATSDILERRAAFSNITSLMAFFTTTVAPIVWFIFSIAYFTIYKTNKKFKFIFKVFIVAEMIFYFPSGSKYVLLLPLIGYFLAAFFLNQKVKKQFIVFSIIVTLFLPLHAMFRLTGIMSMMTIEDVRAQIVAAQKGYLYASFLTLFGRVETFSAYFIFTEKVQNFLHGKTYLPNLYGPIPRFLWPQKPVTLDGNEIGRKYGLIDENDLMTSPAIPKFAEAYLNFGYVGLFGVGIFMSLFFLLIFKYYLTNKTSWSLAIAFAPVFMFIVSAQGPLGGLVSDIIKVFIVFFFIRITIIGTK